MTGGGFGGCTVTLIKSENTKELINAIQEQYKSIVGKDPTIFVTQASSGARIIEHSKSWNKNYILQSPYVLGGLVLLTTLIASSILRKRK